MKESREHTIIINAVWTQSSVCVRLKTSLWQAIQSLLLLQLMKQVETVWFSPHSCTRKCDAFQVNIKADMGPKTIVCTQKPPNAANLQKPPWDLGSLPPTFAGCLRHKLHGSCKKTLGPDEKSFPINAYNETSWEVARRRATQRQVAFAHSRATPVVQLQHLTKF